MARKTLSALSIILILSSCSVKEEREDCPCLLKIYPDGSLDGNIYKSINNSFFITDQTTGIECLNGSLDSDRLAEGNPSKIRIPKGLVSLHSIFGIKKMKEDGNLIKIGNGYQADSVFVYSSKIDCSGETASDTLHLAKQWCSMRISFNQAEDWKVTECLLTGAWNGFDITTLAATKGNFSFEAEALQKDSFGARIPRQGDDSLVLTVIYGDEHLQREYPIGEFIKKAGYNWMKKELDDLVILIDRAEIKVVITVPQWDKGTDYGDVEI